MNYLVCDLNIQKKGHYIGYNQYILSNIRTLEAQFHENTYSFLYNEEAKEFLDFSDLEEIAGTLKGVPRSSRIPAEIVRDGGGTIEVIAEHNHDEENGEEPQILVHRTAEGEVRLVEIICTCGKKIKLQLQYTEPEAE